jgi:hypothetical protein
MIMFAYCANLPQRNFTEIWRDGGDITASLWLETRHQNNEFSECV